MADDLTVHEAAYFETLDSIKREISNSRARAALAAKASVPAYVVFTDATLRDMCAKMPTDEQELLQVSGVGERKAHRYGKAFLEEINRKAEEE